jgi:hypothetical protein
VRGLINVSQRGIIIGQLLIPKQSAVHLGIIRTTSLTENMTINVEENIKKARRSAYGLFGGGYHGNNGLDPDTLIHLLKTYITPVLLSLEHYLSTTMLLACCISSVCF